jgi:hypothetical protein
MTQNCGDRSFSAVKKVDEGAMDHDGSGHWTNGNGYRNPPGRCLNPNGRRGMSWEDKMIYRAIRDSEREIWEWKWKMLWLQDGYPGEQELFNLIRVRPPGRKR